MIGPILQFNAGEVLGALDGLRPIDRLAEELVARAGREAGHDLRSTPWPGPAGAETASGMVLLEAPSTGVRCVLPETSLWACRTATLTVLAARALLGAVPTVVAAVLGLCPATEAYLMLEHRQSAFRQVTVGRVASESAASIEPAVVDLLDLAGISLSVVDATDDLLRGANIVVAMSDVPALPALRRLTRGVVVVNATNRDLPDDFVDSVDRLYVDDAALLVEHPDRHFVRMHMVVRDAEPAPPVGPADWRRHRRVDGDLGQLLAGAGPGRTDLDQVLLVELLGTELLDGLLVSWLHRAALDRGLGVRIVDQPPRKRKG